MPKFIDTGALLQKQGPAIDNGLTVCEAVERVVTLMLRQLCTANHDLGRHAANIYTGATYIVRALNQYDNGAAFDGPSRGCKRGGSRADNGDTRTGNSLAIVRIFHKFHRVPLC